MVSEWETVFINAVIITEWHSNETQESLSGKIVYDIYKHKALSLDSKMNGSSHVTAWKHTEINTRGDKMRKRNSDNVDLLEAVQFEISTVQF